MKKILQNLNILKTDSQKKIENRLKKIDEKKEKERNDLYERNKIHQKNLDENKKKCFELWKNTFRKDFEFKNELLTIAKHVEENTNLDMFLEYSKDINPNDEIIEDKGVKVFIDSAAVMYLLGTEMDYKKEEFSSTFVFNNPNETERCGCGESFKID